jgi:Putative addiction module component
MKAQRSREMTEYREIFNAAMALPEAQKTLLVESLLETMSEDEGELPNDGLSAEELTHEIERRRQEMIDGTAEGIPWSEVRKAE